MKQAIIKTCDIIAYLLFAFIFITTAFMVVAGSILHALMFLVVGWVVASLLSGFWFCLSASATNSALQNETLKRIARLLEKQLGEIK